VNPPENESRDDVNVGLAERKLIHELRGEILSEVNEIEAWIDSIISLSFGFSGRDSTSENFRTWFLSRISLSDKLFIGRQICNSFEVGHVTKGLFERLAWANDVRNGIAHSHVSIDIDRATATSISATDFLRSRTVRYSRSGLSNPRVTAAALAHDRDKIQKLSVHLALLHAAVLTHTETRSVALILAEMYKLNPDTLP